MTEQDVGAAVRRARVDRGVSLRALARRIDVSPATLSALERGLTPLTVARLQRIAEALEVPAERLLRGPGALRGPEAAPPPAADWRRYDALSLDPVLAAAAGLFVRTGFHATTMREIAAEAGLSVAGIYHHHRSKQEILVALLDLTMAEIGWRQRAARAQGRNPAERFALMVESLALFHAHRGDLAFIGASEMRGLRGDDLVRVTALRNQIQHDLDAEVEAAVAAGRFAPADPRTAGRAVATMCTALPSWFRPDGPLTPEQVARRYAALAVAMMHPRDVADQ